jgi:hypothetical protein
MHFSSIMSKENSIMYDRKSNVLVGKLRVLALVDAIFKSYSKLLQKNKIFQHNINKWKNRYTCVYIS